MSRNPREGEQALVLPWEPRSDRSEVSLLVDLYRTVCSSRSAWYLSTPITTGARMRQWAADSAIDPSHPTWVDEHREHVIGPNVRAAERLSESLRKDGRLVINPAGLDHIDGWEQSDYRAMWRLVIERYVERVVMTDGWESSSGCAYEFLVAARSSILVVNESLRPIVLAEGASRISRTLTDESLSSDDRDFLRRVLGALRDLARSAQSAETTGA